MNNQQDDTYRKEMEDKRQAFKYRLESITPQLFFRFLDAKNVTGKCLSCGADGLQETATSGKTDLASLCSGKADVEFVTYFRLEPGHPGDSDQNYYYKSSCENCGFVTMHAVTPVLRWIDSQEQAGGAKDV
ncbi:hypothetical protein [Aeromonas hydrophila]|uniref:hypothetical protein n=1 Tax=Aeromonas hydrophila TaxID=644 RepID=UPI00190F34C0|nr:hypothetical protein [Aeromonas hydrophila]